MLCDRNTTLCSAASCIFCANIGSHSCVAVGLWGGLAEDCDGEDSVEAVDVDAFAEVDFEGAEAGPDDEFSGEACFSGVFCGPGEYLCVGDGESFFFVSDALGVFEDESVGGEDGEVSYGGVCGGDGAFAFFFEEGVVEVLVGGGFAVEGVFVVVCGVCV